MSDPFLLYGAGGYTGRLILERALQLGLRPILGGRDRRKLAPLAERYGLEVRVASLQDTELLHAALRGVRVVLNSAGPFSTTATPMVLACLRAGAHYLDVTGELGVIDGLASRHAQARARGVMVLPGVGFDVVASDCLAVHVASRLSRPTRLAIGIRGLALISRGSALSFFEHAGGPVLIRRAGRITPVAPGELERSFDFGDGPRSCVAMNWGDVASAYYSTGIPDIEVYFEPTPSLRAALLANRMTGPMASSSPWQVWLKAHAALMPEGPSQAERDAVRVAIVAEVEDAAGRRATSRLHTPQSYSFTAIAAPAIVKRVLAGDLEPGFQTPARLYGPDLVLSLEGVAREDLA